MQQDHIGILISPLLYKKIKNGKYPEFISFYEEAGIRHHLIPCFIQYKNLLCSEKTVQALVMDQAAAYKELSIPIPSVIHNRCYHNSKVFRMKLNRLKEEGVMVYNQHNRIGKWKIHKILLKYEELQDHLPDTALLNELNLTKMMMKYDELIIKPSGGTFGKRTIHAKKENEERWKLKYLQNNKWIEGIFTSGQLPEHLLKLMKSPARFLIQKRIPLAEYEMCPFDIRVSVQKNDLGEWQITGMAAKVAKAGAIVTNVAQGGTCYAVSDVCTKLSLSNGFDPIKEIEQFSLKVAGLLEKEINSLSDIGLDIGLTKEGFPMFIECNARDLRHTYRDAGLYEIWKAVYMTPICYGRYLLDLKQQNEVKVRDEIQ